jgi:hypothetical protein
MGRQEACPCQPANAGTGNKRTRGEPQSARRLRIQEPPDRRVQLQRLFAQLLEDWRELLRAELDAYYAHLYGLTLDELRYILGPADVMGANHPTEISRVLKASEQRQFGEYRIRRLVPEAWDRLHAGELHPC